MRKKEESNCQFDSQSVSRMPMNLLLTNDDRNDIKFYDIDWALNCEVSEEDSQCHKGKTTVDYDKQTKEKSKRIRRRVAGAKLRQKKKNYNTCLQQSVRSLVLQNEQIEKQLIDSKTKLVQAIKHSKNNNSQHSYAFTELEQCSRGEDPDIDKINMVLDMLRFRIGANGRERLAKIDYNFKQIVNGLVPALHRYLMYTSEHGQDIYSSGFTINEWTKQLFDRMQLSSQQVARIKSNQQQMRQRKNITMKNVSRLNKVKKCLNQSQEIVQNAMDELRDSLQPLQCALLILFGEKHKYRGEMLWHGGFEDEEKMFEMIAE